MSRLLIPGLALLAFLLTPPHRMAGAGSDGASVAISGAIAPAPSEVLAVAVLPFASRDEQTGQGVTEVMAADLSATPRVSLVERTRLDQVLSELGLSRSSVVDSALAQQVGYLAGADVLVWGRVFVIGRQTMATARIVGVETGRVFVEQVRGSQRDDVVVLMDRLARAVVRRIELERRALRAPESRQDTQVILNDLAEGLKGKPLPKLAVLVQEDGAVSPAQAELMQWLVRCGFPVAELPPALRASPRVEDLPGDVEVLLVGDAAGLPTGAYGPLQTARYRLQVRAVDRKRGEVIAVAQRTGACADLTAPAAVQTGLRRAAASVACELIPLLAEPASGEHPDKGPPSSP